MFKIWFWLLVVDFLLLMWCGSQPPQQPFVIISQLGTLYWFLFFVVVMPLLGVVEKPRPQPETIEADFRAHYAAGAEPVARPTGSPAE
jgi:ubiquinol-cytochrome c reductase cytochrome b subunit